MTDEPNVLSFARTQDYRPGQNVRGAPVGALWLLTLPSISELRSVAFVGRPAADDIEMVRRLAPEADVFHHGHRTAHDLIFVTAAGARGRSLPAVARAARASVKRSGTLMIETRGLRASTLTRADGVLSRGGVAALRAFPLGGSIRALLPEGNHEGLDILGRRGLLRPSIDEASLKARFPRRRPGSPPPSSLARPTRPHANHRRLRAVREVLRGPLAAVAAAERLAATWAPSSRFVVIHGPDAGALPRYLRAAAGIGDEQADEVTWSLVSPGQFASQKLLWFVQLRDEPTMVVKMSRDRRFSHRLHNSSSALQQLATTVGVPHDALPRVLFTGEEAGLAIAGETLASGTAMGRRPSLATNRLARTVIERLTSIGAATRTWSTGPAVAAGLADLLGRAAELGAIGPSEYAFLEGELAVIASLDAPFPVVMQHGDPGVLNILVSEDGEPTILDWENADPNGMPLWDQLYFVRSLGVLRGGTERVFDSLMPFLEAGDLNALLAQAIRAAVVRLKVPEAAIRPLVFHCWVQQALKETTRLASGEASRSIFAAFLANLVARRDTEALRRLWAMEADR